MGEITQIANYRPRRTCLYMPGSNDRALAKAKTLNADVIIFDLEDAVAPDAKTAARSAVSAVLAARELAHRETVIRINALDSVWGQADLAAAIAAGPDAVLVPKITCAADIIAIDAAMTQHGAGDNTALWVMIEMPLAVLNIAEIAAASRNSRLAALVMGTNDLTVELRATATADRAAFITALHMTVTAAHAYNIAAIDGVFNDTADLQGLEDECRQGRVFGFDGKTVIHPAQLDVCNRIFSPDAGTIAHSCAIIAAFADPTNAGAAVIKVDGKMTELLHLEQAKQVISVAEAIGLI